MVENKKPIEEFEGEESLSKEFQENSDSIDENNEETYPYKNINIGRDNFSAFQLFRKYKQGLIKLDPEFQREGNVWSPKQKSELIESVIIGIPLPILYIKEDKSGNWILIDGRQRLSTIFDFLEDKFPLSNLSILKDKNGAYYSKLDNKKDPLNLLERGKIEDINFTLHIIKEPTPERLTYDLFDRVNRGGTRLNNQEMRNAIYQGSSTNLLKVLSKLSSFTKATSNISSTRMKDRYLIIRFIAFYFWRKKISIDTENKEKNNIEYKSDLEDFLAKTMKYINTLKFEIIKDIKIEDFKDLKWNSTSNNIVLKNKSEIIQNADSLLINLIIEFDNSLQNIYSCFESKSFRLPEKGQMIRPINMALFEVMTYYFIELKDEFNLNKKIIKNEYLQLINNSDYNQSKNEDDNFVRSLTYTVDSNKSVLKRFDIIDKKIKTIKENVR